MLGWSKVDEHVVEVVASPDAPAGERWKLIEREMTCSRCQTYISALFRVRA